MADVLKLTVKQARVIELMRGLDKPVFPADIAAADPELFEKGAKSVSPLFNGLYKNGLVDKAKASCETVDKDGKSVTKELMQYSLTDAGKTVEYEIKA